MQDFQITLLVVSGILITITYFVLRWVNKNNYKNFIIRKCTPMPIAWANAHDDVFLEGEAACDSPVYAPHFNYPALHYSYKQERKVTSAVTDSNGKTTTKTSWEVIETAEEQSSFYVKDKTGELNVDITEAKLMYLLKTTDYEGSSLRHTIHYLAYPSQVSIIGSVNEDLASISKRGKVPLLVTPLGREEFLKKIFASVRITRRVAFFLFILAGFLAFYSLFSYLNIFNQSNLSKFDWQIFIAAISASVVLVSPFYLVNLYNRLVALRTLTTNAWQQISVDLKTRLDLIPQLIEVVKALKGYEAQLITSITKLRTEAVTEGSHQGLLLLKESYPDLKANQVFLNLFAEIQAIEEKILHARSVYNDLVAEYNSLVQVFPTNFFAKLWGFKVRDFY